MRSAGGGQHAILETEVRAAVARMGGRLAVEVNDGTLLVCQPEAGNESEAMFFDDGELWTKNPSESFFELMNELAAHLDARIRGDEGESYTAEGFEYMHQDDWTGHRENRPAPPRPWWLRPHVIFKMLVLGTGAVAVFLALQRQLGASV